MIHDLPIGRRRRRRQADTPPRATDTWPPSWRDLAARWLRRNATRVQWRTLLLAAGNADYELAHQFLDALLCGGWVAVEERWHERRWQIQWVKFLDLAALQSQLGIAAPGTHKARLQDARAALRNSLIRWCADPQRPSEATRRDFALYARGDSKGISAAEWEWLASQEEFAASAINRHTPLLCIAADLTLQCPAGALNLAAAGDFLGITPAVLKHCTQATGTVSVWTLVENRTSFERLARHRGADEGVLWLPGFPPGWWQEMVARLLQLAAAPARMACDPDPAGIGIALSAGRLWEAAQLPWQPWRMGVAELSALIQTRPLTADDHERLQALDGLALPAELRALAQALAQGGKKGEQEAYL